MAVAVAFVLTVGAANGAERHGVMVVPQNLKFVVPWPSVGLVNERWGVTLHGKCSLAVAEVGCVDRHRIIQLALLKR